jgi:hypothetical protein
MTRQKSKQVGISDGSGSDNDGNGSDTNNTSGVVGNMMSKLFGTNNTKNKKSTNSSKNKKSSKTISPINGDSSDEDGIKTVVWERGYNSQDEMRMHPEQMGSLAGEESVQYKGNRDWAQRQQEGRVVRRHQNDGPR